MTAATDDALYTCYTPQIAFSMQVFCHKKIVTKWGVPNNKYILQADLFHAKIKLQLVNAAVEH